MAVLLVRHFLAPSPALRVPSPGQNWLTLARRARVSPVPLPGEGPYATGSGFSDFLAETGKQCGVSGSVRQVYSRVSPYGKHQGP